MNTTKLKRFATEARNKLRQGVEKRLAMLGFDDAGIPAESPKLVSGGAVWKDKPCTVAFYNGFKSLEEQIRRYGVSHVVEEAAYTWFNRLMAIRILTMNELCEPVLRYVGSTRTPLIVDEARQGHIPEMDEEDREALMKLIDDDTKTAEQFAMLISAFCHNTPIIAKCFSLQSDYTDVLFPANILSENGFIDMLNTSAFISEEDYHSSELLGWLYQFYISEKKDQVFAKKGKYDADDIPAATQIFTPNWIVKYMVQNTIGGVLGGKDKLPENQRKYYVDTPEPPKAICRDIEDLKVADLACGSGHILNECFDLLYDLYISEGYTRREAIECIFTQNLTGIDIDTRAKQLATFALMLKACQRDSSLVDASLMPHVYDMSGMPEESRELGSIQIFDEPDSNNPVIAALSTHYDAIVMNPPYMPTNRNANLSSYVNINYKDSKADLYSVFITRGLQLLKSRGRLGVVTMEAWMFLSSFENFRKELLKNSYISSLSHFGWYVMGIAFGTVSAIIENIEGSNRKGIYSYLEIKDVDEHTKVPKYFPIKDNGRYSEMSQNYFNFIPGSPIAYWISESLMSAFEGSKLKDYGDSSKGIITGNNNMFIRLWHEVANKDIEYNANSNDDTLEKKWYPLKKGGGARKWYGNLEHIIEWKNKGHHILGMAEEEGRNKQDYADKFKFKPSISWSAICSGMISFRYSENDLCESGGMTYFPKDDKFIYSILAFLNSKVAMSVKDIINPTYNVTAGNIEAMPAKIVLSNTIDKLAKDSISIARSDWDAHETSWDFEKNPLLDESLEIPKEVTVLKYDGEKNNEILYPESVRCDANLENRLITLTLNDKSLYSRYVAYRKKWTQYFRQLLENEEKLNQQFIELYGLKEELDPIVPANEITILQQGEMSPEGDDVDGMVLCWHPEVVMKQFISYAVGCMMGRYRLDRPGLAIAHPNETPEEIAEYPIPGTDEKFWIDDDGIIPLMPEDCGFHDNAVNRFATFVRQTLGDQTQVENLNFIEECLGKSLEQYFIKDFWKDHKKMYQNRPIYWLFASKKGAFQVLVYVHRMNVATVERIRSRYLLPYIERLNKRIEDLQANESTLSTKQRNQLKTLRAQVAECEEYHNRLAVVAERGIVPNLDDGILKNHALYGDIVTKLK